jgi:serine protease Do
VLTNYHVIEDAATNSSSWIQVAIEKNPDDPPVPMYRGELVEYDPDLDLAVLRLSGLDGSQLPASPGLPAIPLGDSDRIQIGDELVIIGFPSIGGETVTLTRGTVSGFHAQGSVTRAWIKTDTEASPGNSGGMAINAGGELIGIPTWVSAEDRTLGRIGVLRPVNLARPLIQRAP